VDGDEPFDYLGFDQQPGTSIFLANSIQVLDFNAPNERSWQLRYDLDMAPFGVPGLSFMSRYVRGDHIDDSHYDGGPNGAYGRYGDDGKRWERDLEARYVVQSGKARDLSVRVRQASVRSTAQVARADTTDNNEVRVIIEYPLSIF
jgi:imipenem/basic amino acid-specific outer membrane pore